MPIVVPRSDTNGQASSPPPDASSPAKPTTFTKRTEDAACNLPEHDTEYWLEDGNFKLTIIASNVDFLISKGPLVTNSPVFKDLLSILQPDGTSGSQCTCGTKPAVVHVSDSPEDLRHVFRALLPGKTPRVTPEALFFQRSICVRQTWAQVRDRLHPAALRRLPEEFFVQSFETWARVDPLRPPAFEAIHSIGVVNISRMTSPDVLPTALMGCCMLNWTELVGFGFTREDGTWRSSPEDIGRCFLGRVNLLQANTMATLGVFEQTLSEGCTRRDVCGPVFLNLLDELRNHERVVCTLDWFKYWSDYIDGRDDDRRICARCYKMLQEREKEQHRGLWKKLPELMGVVAEGWAAGPTPAEEVPPAVDGGA
ncbi:hypothetical protein BD310DRAFT_127481 [Dichomitus squalens]|uniref:BTB domain-containing protein n=1 Tax=Dichomitus squalens TaxID=114155 RepID=A0A4Q9PIL5_9APHY|nr:hypothetical protein BD310DRAFT_127481 [Dichomitus squalens]